MSEPSLSVQKLSAGYGPEPVLTNITLSLKRGEALAVQGTNGAGKSTLLLAIAGILRSSGSIHLEGVDLTRRRPHERARLGLGFVPQLNKVFDSMTVAENLVVGLRDSGFSSRLAIDNAFRIFPEFRSYPEIVATNLSAGQKQMVALARVIVRKPKCLLLDEPSAGLSEPLWSRVLEQLATLAADGTSMIVVEHGLSKLDGLRHSTWTL